MTRALAVLVVIAGLLVATTGAAHERSQSRATVRVAGNEAFVQLSVSARELDTLVGALSPSVDRESWAATYVTRGLRVLGSRGACTVDPGSVHALAAPLGRTAWEWAARCPPATEHLAVESRLFEELAPHHLVFLRIAQGTRVDTEVLTEGHRAASVDVATGGGPSGFSRYVRLGIGHILSGYDHLAFLVALLVVAASLREVARVVTGFTVGHSATLALAALGWVHPDARLVEAAIGVSIAVVAAENVWAWSGHRGASVPVGVVVALAIAAAVQITRFPPATWALSGMAIAVSCYFALLGRSAARSSLRGAIAAGFGLVHGLGFAGAFAESPVPTGDLVGALLGFNVGVELGQLAVGVCVYLALAALREWRPRERAWLTPVASAAVCGAGVYWMVFRLG